MKPFALLLIFGICAAVAAVQPSATCAEPFSYLPPGDLIPGSGEGAVDYNVYLPGMRFPIENAPAYANSQVYLPKGPAWKGCDDSNYSYPWRDNFCETRGWTTPMCPTGFGHQGQDIRPSTCVDNYYWAVAAENGTITGIGFYSVTLQGDSGMRHMYLHLHENSLVVYVDKVVKAGDRIGRISDNFGNECGGTDCTTYHLHYEMTSGGIDFPPYMSLVSSYKELIGYGIDERWWMIMTY